MGTTRAIRAALCAAALSIGLPGDASSQVLNRQTDREGIRIGSIRILPTLREGVAYDTNIFRENTNRDQSFILRINPEVDIVTDWNRHGLRLSLGSEYVAFTNDSDDNLLNFNGELAGVLDITRTIRLSATIGYARSAEARGSDDTQITLRAVEPTKVDAFYASFLGEAAFGRFIVAPFLDVRHRDFTDVGLVSGGTLNNDDRDRTEIETGAQLSYEVRSGFSAFVRPSFINVNYADAFADNGINRDATAYRVLTGMKVDLTRLIEASVGVGYVTYNYHDPRQSNFSGFAVDARGIWSLSRRLQLTFGASRSVAETTVNNSSGAIETSGQIGAEYSALRNVVLRANAGYLNVDYDGSNRTDHLLSSGFGLDWRVTRDLTLIPFYRFNLRDSSVNVLDYTDHRVSFDLVYRF